MPDDSIHALLNPLVFIELELPRPGSTEMETVDAEHVLNFLTNPGEPSGIAHLVARYQKINIEDPKLFAAPAEQRLLERLIWPLRQAKGSFVLGHYLATISLCGMVAEMAAILSFDLANISINRDHLDEGKQKLLFGSSFEKQGQDRRVQILFAYGIIGDKLKSSYDVVRTARRRYLHLWSADHDSLEQDAIQCFTSVVGIVVATLGLSMQDGKLLLRQEVLQYLRDHNAGPTIHPGDA